MKLLKVLFAGLAISGLVGCGGFEASSPLLDVNEGKLGKGDRPACEIQGAEYALDTKMVGFEIESSNGVNLGFNLLQSFFRVFNVNFKMKTGRMSMAMSLYDPIKPQYELFSVLGSGKMRETEFGFDFNFYQVGVGFEHYSKTPIAKLAERSLTDTFTNLTKKVTQLQDKWSTDVVARVSVDEVVVPVGGFTGIKIGDQFAIYNVEHVWRGEPCMSEHLMARKTTPYPVAVAQVTQLENNAALLTVIQRDDYSQANGLDIELGAMVEVHKLVGEKRAALYRSLEIRSIVGAKMSFENDLSLDMTPHLTDQIRAIARNHGFSVFRPSGQ